MAKKNEVTTLKTNSLEMPSKLVPADVVGMNTSKMMIDPANLPDHLKGITFDVIETGFAPTVKWNEPGEFVAGVLTDVQEKVGPNNANLYLFDAQGKEFGVWGSAVLDRAIMTGMEKGIIKKGYLLMITYAADLDGKNENNPTRLFHIQVAKK